MKTLKIGGENYTLEYSFEAAECKDVVQGIFEMLSFAPIAKRTGGAESEMSAMVGGTSEMVALIPVLCRNAFYAGLLENNPVSEDEAKTLMKAYMKENDLTYPQLMEEISACMEEDGFLKLSGVQQRVEEMYQTEEEETEELPKTPQDHKKKQTSAK